MSSASTDTVRASLVPISLRNACERVTRSLIEPLERREYLAVTTDVNGNTVVTPEADSRIIYVNPALGNDANSGLTPEAPVATITAGIGKVRAGMPDQLLLKRGEVFSGSNVFPYWTKSGRSTDQPMYIGSYGDGDSPLVKVTSGSAFRIDGGVVNHVVLQGINFWAATRDPSSPDYIPGASGATNGVHVLGTASDLLVEGCTFKSFRINMDFESYRGPVGDIRLRRNEVLDSYDTVGHSQGLYAADVDGLLIEGNLFDHNGWNESIPGAKATVFNHNIYYSYATRNVVIRDNILANASSHGINGRGGGIIENNLFFRNPIGMTFGLADGSTGKAGGVTGQITGNAFVETRDLNGDKRGWGIAIGNTKPGSNVLVSDNIFAQDTQLTTAAIVLSSSAPVNASEIAGLNDVTIAGNKVYGWYGGLATDSKFVNGGIDNRGYNNVIITGNDFQKTTSRIVDHAHPFDPTEETWSDNRYWSVGAQSSWFRINGVTTSFATWQQNIDPTGTAVEVQYTDPGRTAGSYNATIGGTGTLAGFIAAARAGFGRDYRYDTANVLNYIRAGYADSDEGAMAPVVKQFGGSFVFAQQDAATYFLNVQFGTTAGIDLSTLGDDDITVTRPDGSQVSATLVTSTTINGQSVATYMLVAPDGVFDPNDNGTYKFFVNDSAVTDTAGVTMHSGLLGTAKIDFEPGDTTAPTYVLGALPKGSANKPQISFTITYTDDTLVSRTTVDNADLRLTGPNGYSRFGVLSSVTSSDDGKTRTATYMFSSPNGVSWKATDAGAYTLSLESNAVTDGTGNAAAAGVLSNFALGFSEPTAVGSLTNLSLAQLNAASSQFPIVYYDDVGIDIHTMAGADITITGPTGASVSHNIASITGPLTERTSIYNVFAPGGTWDAADNGVYTVSIVGNSMFDGEGNAVAAGLVGTFKVDMTRPFMTLTTPPVVTNVQADQSFVDFTVSFTENDAMDIATIVTGNVKITSTSGNFTQTPELVSYDPTTKQAIYRMLAPGGTWDAADSGNYSAFIGDVVPTDLVGNTAAPSNPTASIGGFTIDLTNPVASLTAPSVTTNGGTSYDFTVGYSDNRAVDWTTIGDGNIRVTGPNDFDQEATFVSLNGSTATYRVTFERPIDSSLNGTYAFEIGVSPVSDTSGNPAVPTSSPWETTFSLPATPPTANVSSSPNVTGSPGATSYAFDVTFDDDVAINPSTIDGAVGVRTPIGIVLPATLVSSTGTSSTTSTYSVTPPGGSWDSADNGTYTIVLLDGVLKDTAGTSAEGADLKTFTVAVNATPPTASMEPFFPIITNPSTNITLSVTYSDDLGVDANSIGNGDVSVVRTIGGVADPVVTFTSYDATTGVATYSIAAPGGSWDYSDNGYYAIGLNANAVYDVSGTPAAAASLGLFNVNIPAPQSAPVLVLHPSADTGTSNTDGVTSRNSASDASLIYFIVSNVSQGASITLYADGNAVGAAVVLSESALVVSTTALSDGVHVFTATQTLDGQTSPASTPLSVTIDTTAPTGSLADVSVGYDAPDTLIDLGAAITDAVGPLSFDVSENTNASLFTSVSIDAATKVLKLDYAAVTAGGSSMISIAATDAAGNAITRSFDVAVAPQPAAIQEVILDNNAVSGVVKTGAWLASAGVDGYYGTDFLQDNNANKGSLNVTYTATLSPGSYQVYAWWTAKSNRASKVPVSITHAAGASTVNVDQRSNGGKWNLLGTYNFDTNGKVVISNTGTSGYVAADAVRFLRVGDPPVPTAPTAPTLQTLTPLSTTSMQVKWADNSDNETGFDVQYSSTSDFAAYTQVAGGGANTTSATVTGLTTGATYYFRVVASNGTLKSFSNVVQAAMVYSPPSQVEIILDNDSTGVTKSSGWSASSSDKGYLGSNYLQDGNTGRGTKWVTYTPTLPSAGQYEVWARWTSSNNRTTSARYEIVGGTGQTAVVVTKSQRTDGGTWVLLGTYNLSAGASVTLRNTGADGYVVADAVRFLTTGEPPVPTAPIAPTLQSVAPLSATSMQVKWADNSDNETAFDVQYSSTSDFAAYTQVTGGGANTTSANVTGLTTGTTYYFRVVANNGTLKSYSNAIQATMTYTPPTQADIILDNDSAGVIKSSGWSTSSSDAGYLGSNYLHDGNTGRGSKWVTYTPTLPTTGQYEIWARWTASNNRASNARYEIVGGTGQTAQVVTKSQKTNGGIWVLLGTYDLATGATVTIRNTGADGYVVADGIKFVKVS